MPRTCPGSTTFLIRKTSINSWKVPIVEIIRSESNSAHKGWKKMFKNWKRNLAATLVLGCASGAALAQKLTMNAVSKPTTAPMAQKETTELLPPPNLLPQKESEGSLELKPIDGADGPQLVSAYEEKLPMPPTIMEGFAPDDGGAVFFGGEEFNGNGWERGFFFGVGLHVLRPVVSNNRSLITTVTNGKGGVTDSETSFDYDFSGSPSIWVGYSLPNGLGGAISWFRYDQRSRPIQAIQHPADPVTGAATTFSSASGFLADGTIGAPLGAQANILDLNTSLLLDIWDFDLTQRLTLGQVDVIAGAGIRYLHMAQRFRGSINQTGPAAGEVNSAFESATNSFSGVGPTLMLDVQRPIGFFGLALYANARAGLLFGSRHEGDFTATVTNPGGGGATVITPGAPFTYRSDQTVGFGEVELGVEWAGQFGRFLPFARLGFEARDYLNTGNSQSIYLTHSTDVGLYGIAIHAGLGF